MILVDTNVLIYAIGSTESVAELAAGVLAYAGDRDLRITPRVLEEFAHVHARRTRDRVQAREYCEELAAHLGPLEYASEEDIAVALETWAAQPNLDFADALLAAQALRHECPLVSADKAFGEVAGLQWIDLAAPDLLERIQAT